MEDSDGTVSEASWLRPACLPGVPVGAVWSSDSMLGSDRFHYLEIAFLSPDEAKSYPGDDIFRKQGRSLISK